MVNSVVCLGILSVILVCDALFIRKCIYREECRCGASKTRFIAATNGCNSILGKCQLDCPKGLLSLDLGSNLRHLGLNLYSTNLCKVFEYCTKCNPVGFNCSECPHFKYGPVCEKNCQCPNSISCEQNGKCICKEGYKGNKCEQKIVCIPPYVEPPLQQEQYTASFPIFINYTCPQPYYLVGGNSEIRCINGKWDGIPPLCVIKCSAPSVPENGGVKGIQGENTDVGTTVTYFCRKEYSLIGNEVATCNADGNWNDTPPECVKLKLCSVPGTVLNADKEERIPVKLASRSYPVDSIIVYTCKKQFLMDGDSTLTCQEDQKWSSNLPKCFKVAEKDVTCNTKANEVTEEVGVPVRIHCPSGCARNSEIWGTVIYKANSSICSAAIHSEKIENTGGSVYVINYGKTKDFVGSNINGIFSKSFSRNSDSFKLERISPLESDLTGRLKGCPATWTQVEEQCMFVVKDHKAWNASQYTCQNLGGYLSSLNNKTAPETMAIMKEQDISTAWIGLRRNSGKFNWIGTSEDITNESWAKGQPIEDCVAVNANDGKWKTFSCNNNMPFICAIDLLVKKKARCSLPEPILNGRITNQEIEGEVLEGVTIVFHCDQFHRMSGNSNITCTESGEWNHPPPNCIKVPMCKELPSPEYGIVEISSTQNEGLSRSAFSAERSHTGGFRTGLNADLSDTLLPNGFYPAGSLASYKCQSRYYELVGSKTRRCQEDSAWSGRPAICIPVCGRSDSKRQPFILYGNATEMGQWPWQVALSYLVPEYNVWFIFCGGTLLNENWVITAAHCMTISGTTNVKSPDIYRVYLGKYHRDNKLDDDAVQIRKVREVHVHPDFDPYLFDGDIALLLLDKPVTLTSRVQPVCLPNGISTRNNLAEGTLGVVTGWGLNENNTYLQELEQAAIPVVSHKECEKGYRDAKLPLTVTENMYCAGIRESAIGICTGDSGGPMVFPDDNRPERRWTLEGIVSWGSPSGCGFTNQYGGFTKVNNYKAWIQKFI